MHEIRGKLRCLGPPNLRKMADRGHRAANPLRGLLCVRESIPPVFFFFLYFSLHCSTFVCQARKKEPKPNLLSPDVFRSGRGLPREGVGAKRFGMSLKPGKSNFLGGIIPEAPEKFEKKFVFNFWPLVWGIIWRSFGHRLGGGGSKQSTSEMSSEPVFDRPPK